MSDLTSSVWSDDLEFTFRKAVYRVKHQATNTGLLKDPDGPWIKMMTSHILGARWPSTDPWVTESHHQGAGFGEVWRPVGVL